jgi:hypothetical protein
MYFGLNWVMAAILPILSAQRACASKHHSEQEERLIAAFGSTGSRLFRMHRDSGRELRRISFRALAAIQIVVTRRHKMPRRGKGKLKRIARSSWSGGTAVAGVLPLGLRNSRPESGMAARQMGMFVPTAHQWTSALVDEALG